VGIRFLRPPVKARDIIRAVSELPVDDRHAVGIARFLRAGNSHYCQQVPSLADTILDVLEVLLWLEESDPGHIRRVGGEGIRWEPC